MPIDVSKRWSLAVNYYCIAPSPINHTILCVPFNVVIGDPLPGVIDEDGFRVNVTQE
jgi:hypothetical protein